MLIGLVILWGWIGLGCVSMQMALIWLQIGMFLFFFFFVFSKTCKYKLFVQILWLCIKLFKTNEIEPLISVWQTFSESEYFFFCCNKWALSVSVSFNVWVFYSFFFKQIECNFIYLLNYFSFFFVAYKMNNFL